MESLANMVIAFTDLAEAEGRAAHRGVIRLCVRLVAILGAAVLGVIGLLLVASGIYMALAHWLGDIAASLICGVFLLSSALALYLYGRVPPKRPEQSRTFPLDNDEQPARSEEGQNHDEPLRSHASV